MDISSHTVQATHHTSGLGGSSPSRWLRDFSAAGPLSLLLWTGAAWPRDCDLSWPPDFSAAGPLPGVLWAGVAWSRECDLALASACSLLAEGSALSGTALTLEASPRASRAAVEAWAQLASEESARCEDCFLRSLLDLLPLSSGLGESWLPWCSGTAADACGRPIGRVVLSKGHYPCVQPVRNTTTHDLFKQTFVLLSHTK